MSCAQTCHHSPTHRPASHVHCLRHVIALLHVPNLTLYLELFLTAHGNNIDAYECVRNKH